MRTLNALLILLIVGVLSANRAHARDSEIWGGPGGAQFTLPCEPGEYLVGIAGAAGEWIDKVAPICATWNGAERRFVNEHIPDANGADASAGGNGGDPLYRPCGEGRFIRTLHLRATHAGDDPTEAEYIGAIEMQCWSALTRGFVSEDIGRSPRGLARQYVSCGRREVAVGLIGRADHFVDALGLLCAPAVIQGETGQTGPGMYRRADQPIQGEVGRETPAPAQARGDIPIQGEAGQETPQSNQNRDAPIQGENDPFPGGATPN